jgi:A/G-specific adenine glycosylase
MPSSSSSPRNAPSWSRAASRQILRWYSIHGRTLPWRNIRDPYRILVAEIMLQQTQVNRVLRLYPLFLKRFPTLKSLASARQSQVVVAWKGMGYNTRAVRLHRLAHDLLEMNRGMVPRSIEACTRLPGIGRYTAHALVVSIYGEDHPVVDVNIRRVLSRLFWRMRTTREMKREEEIWTLASKLVPHRRGYVWTQALMDLGATVCTARNPRCGACPVSARCLSARAMIDTPLRRRLREPSLRGVPNRIYRGRIVDILRTSRRPLKIQEIGRKVVPTFSPRHGTWLRKVIQGLRSDGLITVRGNIENPSARILLA